MDQTKRFYNYDDINDFSDSEDSSDIEEDNNLR